VTRPTRPSLPFQVAIAPSRSRPPLPAAKVQEDAEQLLRALGDSGLAGLTEITGDDIKQVIRDVFGGNRLGVTASDCPIVWTDDWRKLEGGVEFGCKAIRGVMPDRHDVWGVFQRASGDGPTVGLLSTHMAPGGWRPRGRQIIVAPLIRWRWRQHRRVIEHRLRYLEQRCDVVFPLGDINRPGLFTFLRKVYRRLTGRGLLYMAVSRSTAGHTSSVHYKPQNADHQLGICTHHP
jgi:hypothetical protein